jgi:TolA-binding protein
MSDLGSSYPVALNIIETREMKLKWLKAAKQERISKISHLRQAIDDMQNGKIPDLERQILHAQQELQQLEAHEKTIVAAVDTNN